MDYKILYFMYEQDYSKSLHGIKLKRSEFNTDVEAELKESLKNGWRIASTCPIIKSRLMDQEGIGSDIGTTRHVYTYTDGIEIFLVKE